MKHIRNAIDLALDASRRIKEATDQTVYILAEANRLVRPPRRRKMTQISQLELYGS